MRHRVILAVFLLPALARGADAPAPDAAGVEFFEKKVRPVLARHCYACHSAEAQKNRKLRGGLRLDSREGVRKGGDSGPALVPGKPGDSLLVRSVRHDGERKMPPAGKLPDAVVADLERWVRMGAPDPRTAAPVAAGPRTGMSLEEGRAFWAYRPPHRPALPAVRDTAWPANDVDRFILARLEREGLRPAPEAGREVLARRLSFDLLGLPPTPEEIDAFAADTDPGAYEKLVDRLLASPHFGERWGRHWLDVARFAESLTLRGFVLKEAWRYRDHVIDAFNEDVPFDRFVREQVAGDLLPAATAADRRRQLAATTFLTLGNTNLEEQDKKQLRMDVVDEQLDVIGKAVLAQTITCARCHDHKFDPIPTQDYYALAGILRNTRVLEHANVSRWIEVSLPADPPEEALLQKHEAAVKAIGARIQAARAGAAAGRGVLEVGNVPGIVVDDSRARKVGEWKESQWSGSYIGRGYLHDLDAGKGTKTLTFQPDLPAGGKYEVWLAYSPGDNRADAVPVTVFSADGEKTIRVDMKKAPPLHGRFLSLGQYHFERNGQGFVLVANEGTKGHVTADAVVFLPADRLPSASPVPPKTGDAEALRALEVELKRLQREGPRRAMAMSVVEEPQIEDARVHVRGSVHNLGVLVPRGFLRVATPGPAPAMPARQSGRRELAGWLTSPDNPLTARVIVNRAWHWLFGSGIVRTMDNFGTTGEAPSHPELLDHLAVRFVEDGWSVKRLVRAIVLSRTYRQSSSASAAALAADPENRWFGRANRRRLDAECLRDALLSVSGRLRRDRGGPTFPEDFPADYGFRHADTRRSVYAPVFRNALPELFAVFDFADPSMVVGRRNASTVAPQALFFLNNPFVVEQSRHAAARLLAGVHGDEERIERLYRLALGRLPEEGERRVARRFLGGRAGDPAAQWSILFQAVFASADFRYAN